MSLEALRAALINEIWSGDGFPTDGVTLIESDVVNPLNEFATPSNLLRCDKYNYDVRDRNGSILEFPPSFTGVIYHWLWVPSSSNGKLAIWHFGHSADVNASSNGNLVIRDLVEAGYTVAGCIMPGTVISSTEHNNTFPARTTSLNMLRAFVEGPIRLVNEHQNDFEAFYMFGHSGGGWATPLVAAIDTRISKSWHNAGSQPFQCANARDFEQQLPGIAEWCDYQDLYLLGSDNGRKQRQSCNVNDTCCFNRPAYMTIGAIPYHWPMLKKARELGCDWDLIWDKNGGHEVTPATRVKMVDFAEDRVFEITEQPVSQVLYEGQDLPLSIGLSIHEGDMQWEWKIDGEWAPIDGLNNVDGLIPNVTTALDQREIRFTVNRHGFILTSDVITVTVWEPIYNGVDLWFNQSGEMYVERLATGEGTTPIIGNRVGTWVASYGDARFVGATDARRPELASNGLKFVASTWMQGDQKTLELAGDAETLVLGMVVTPTTELTTPFSISVSGATNANRFMVRVNGTSVFFLASRTNLSTGSVSKTVNDLSDKTGVETSYVFAVDYTGNRMMAWRDGIQILDSIYSSSNPSTSPTESGDAMRTSLFGTPTGATPFTGAIKEVIVAKDMSLDNASNLAGWFQR